jgi:hypothetical protein
MMGPPPGQPGYGGPPPGPGYPPPQYPQNNAFAPPQQDLPGPLDDLARRMPGSQPGTVFGFPVARLRDDGLQRKALFLLGVALVASIFVPYALSPTTFAWSFPNKFRPLIWPILAGAAYLLVAAAPPHIRAKVPPVVLQWLPFSVAFLGVQITGLGAIASAALVMGGELPGSYYLYSIGMCTLIFGLLARIANPNDQTARIIIAVGGGMLFPLWLDMFDAFKFSGGFIMAIYGLLTFLVTLLGILCIVFVVPPVKLPPALKAVDALAPLIIAILIAWLPLEAVLFAIEVMRKQFMPGLLGLVRSLLVLAAYFGVLMLTAPAAYEAIMGMAKKGGGAGGGGYPPPGGGYPPPGGGYPPQGGGYPPPQGGGYPPPQGGGYPPPQGGGYPPPQGGGGGWPGQ